MPQQGCLSLLGRGRGSLVPTGLRSLVRTPVEQRTLQGLEASPSRPRCLPYPPRAGGAGDTLGQRCSVFLASCEAVTGLFAGGGPSSFCRKEEGGRWGRGLESHLQTLQGTVGGAERSPASCPPDPMFCGRAGGAAPCIPSMVTEPLGAWTGFGQSAGSTHGSIIQASAPACGLSYPPCLPRTRRRLWLRTSTLR